MLPSAGIFFNVDAQLQILDIPNEIKVGYSTIGLVHCGRALLSYCSWWLRANGGRDEICSHPEALRRWQSFSRCRECRDDATRRDDADRARVPRGVQALAPPLAPWYLLKVSLQ